MTASQSTPAPAPNFDATLRPQRSLSARGFRWVFIALVTVWFTVGLSFLLRGAWPVFGLMGLEILLLYVALKASYRTGQLRERVRLWPDELRVERIWPNGLTRSWAFQPAWLRVEMDDPPRQESRLALRSHGQTLAIGHFLTPQERLDFARALRRALARVGGRFGDAPTG